MGVGGGRAGRHWRGRGRRLTAERGEVVADATAVDSVQVRMRRAGGVAEQHTGQMSVRRKERGDRRGR